MIGDSLESDIIPAKNAGIEKTVWLKNVEKAQNENKLCNIQIIHNLKELENIF